METLRYGVIGCGRVSSRHMDAAEQVPGLELAAIADVNIEKAETIASKRASNPRTYADYRDLLADDSIDVVVIAVPTHMHAEVTAAAAEAGKHIYCEKAMAPTLNECRRMISATDDAGVKLMIGQSTRYRKPFMQARRCIEKGDIGEVVAVDASFSGTATTEDDVPEDFWRFKAGAQGHGYVVNFGCHYIDTSRFLAGQDPAAITALINNRFSQGIIPEDQFVITCTCRDEAIITIGLYGTPKHQPAPRTGYTIHGTEGVIGAYWRPNQLLITQSGSDPEPIEYDDDLTEHDCWYRLHRDFRKSIVNDTEPPITGRDGMLNVQWALGAYLADERRQWVDLPLGPEYYEYAGPTLHETISPGDS